jgi:hypothetical protein
MGVEDRSLISDPIKEDPIKEDVKKKILPPPLAGDVDVVLASSPVSFHEGLLVWPL